MGDWWNLGDDWKRLQQGAQTLEGAGEAAVRLGEYFLQEGITGLEDIIPDLLRILAELEEDPFGTIPLLLDHIRRVGMDVGHVLREFVAGVNAYGAEGYGRRLISQLVIGPYEQALRQASVKASTIGAHHLATIAGVQQRLAPLHHASGAAASGQTVTLTTGPSASFQGDLADTALAQFTEAQARLNAAATALGGESGYTLQDALNDAQRDMNNTWGIRIAAIVIIDLILLAGCIVVDAATGGIALIATPAEIGAIAVIDLIIWFLPYILHLLQWMIAALLAAVTATSTSSSAQTTTQSSSSGSAPDPKLDPKLGVAIAAAIGVSVTILIVALNAHQRQQLKDQLAALFPHCKDHLDDLLNKYPDLTLDQLIHLLQTAQLRAQLVAMQDLLNSLATNKRLQQAVGNWLKRIKELIRALDRAMQDPKSLTDARYGGYLTNVVGVWGEIALCLPYLQAGQLLFGPRKVGDVKADFGYNDGHGDTYVEVKNVSKGWDTNDPNWPDDKAQAEKFAEAAKANGATNIEWDSTGPMSDEVKQALRDIAHKAGFDDAHTIFKDKVKPPSPPDPKEHPYSDNPSADWCDPNAWPPYSPTP